MKLPAALRQHVWVWVGCVALLGGVVAGVRWMDSTQTVSGNSNVVAGSITNSTIQIIPSPELAGLIKQAEQHLNGNDKELKTLLLQIQQLLGQQLAAQGQQAVSVGAVQTFLATIKGKQVPPEEWPQTFAELTRQFFKLGQEIQAIPATSEEIKALLTRAETARQAGDLAEADRLLASASTLADQAFDAQELQYRQAARQSAAVLASRGTLALTRLEREAGARFLVQAFERRKLEVDSESLWWLLEAGDAMQTAGNTAGALRLYRQAQQAAEAGGEALQRDLSVSHNRVGDVQVAQGDLAAALKSYQAGLEIPQTLARVDPGNQGWQRDLSVSHNKVGDVQVAQGDLAAALKSYQAGLEIAQTLVRMDPGNAEWQVDVAVSCWKLGQKLGSAGGSIAQRQAWLQQGLDVLQRLHREGRLAPNRQSWIGMFERALAALK